MRFGKKDRSTSTQSRTKSGIPVARLLPMVIASLVLFATLPVLILGYIGADDNTSRLLRDRSEATINDVVDRITAHLELPREQIQYIQQAAAKGIVEVGTTGDRELDTFILGALAGTPQVTGIGHILPDHSMRRYDRNDIGMYVEDASRVPGAEDSLAVASRSDAVEWMPAVWSPILGETILPLAASLRDPNGTFLGAIVAAVTTSELSRYLKTIKARGGPKSFILAGEDRVVAHPHLAEPGATGDLIGDVPLPTIDAVGDPVLNEIWGETRNPLSAMAPFREAEGHWTWVGDSTHAYVYRTIPGFGRDPWIVGIHFPGIESRRERWIVRGYALGGMALLFLSLAVAVVLGRRLGRPIVGLASAAERIEAFDFESVQQLPRGPIREVNWAAEAFERTAAGLRLFETYVPEPVARALIANRGALPPEEAVGTVLFADIEKFTTIVEAMPPTQVIEMLNEYFGAVAEIIGRNRGVINQFQGDAVLATFNVPVLDPDHARSAVDAAMEIQAAVHDRLFAGELLRVRIGINTGRIVGGSVGTDGRCNYTVHGDAVNLAARLEGLNTEYRTRILVTETVVEQAGISAGCRRVGTLQVRGRSTPVTLFSVENSTRNGPDANL